MIGLVSLLALLTPQGAMRALDGYLKRADSNYEWKVASRGKGRLELDLTSQTWRGVPWKHKLIVVEPKRLSHRGIAVLIITGGDPNPADLRDAQTVADGSGMPVATLFHIPVQPIFGLKEDELIAHTFEQFLTSGDETWPLLFPMVKSAVRAMDALSATTARSSNSLKKFVVTGASKRGWTTWLTAATGDSRVVGIAPMSFDNLNFRKQLAHQLTSWGKYSEMISAYTDRGLQKVLDSERGMQLVQMVDPYAYLDRFKAPTFIVNGTNDRYWTVDALRNYWGDLKQPKWAMIIPNAGHNLGDGRRALEGLANFARACAGEFKLPTLRLQSTPTPNGIEFELECQGAAPVEAFIWKAEADALDFRDSMWSKEALIKPGSNAGPKTSFIVVRPKRNAAFFAEATFRIRGRNITLTAPVEVFPIVSLKPPAPVHTDLL